jgi:hypothetical protein
VTAHKVDAGKHRHLDETVNWLAGIVFGLPPVDVRWALATATSEEEPQCMRKRQPGPRVPGGRLAQVKAEPSVQWTDGGGHGASRLPGGLGASGAQRPAAFSNPNEERQRKRSKKPLPSHPPAATRQTPSPAPQPSNLQPLLANLAIGLQLRRRAGEDDLAVAHHHAAL